MTRSTQSALAEWGWRAEDDAALAHGGRAGEPVGRVIAEHAGLFRVKTDDATLLARPTGKLRQRIEKDPALRPIVGDWVILGSIHKSGESALAEVLPRRTFISRKDPDNAIVQPIVANVDRVFLVTSLAGDLSLRRLERYLATVFESGAEPVIVLTKADLVGAVETAIAEVRTIAPDVAVHAVSVRSGVGLPELDAELRPGVTIALIGSSGVGKSTLINRWLGTEELSVGEVGDLGKGRHTTTHRHLVKIPSGALLIDTPGMREMGLWEAGEGVEAAFGDIEELGERCRFRDCAHENEPGCAVRTAVDRGELDAERYASFRKLKAELARLAEKGDAQARAARKGSDKSSTRALQQHVRKKRR